MIFKQGEHGDSVDDLIKAMEAGIESNSNIKIVGENDLKVESLDSSLFYMKATKQSISAWKMLELFTMKIKLPRKLKKKLNLIESESIKESYRYKLITRAGFIKQYTQYKITQALIQNRFDENGFSITKKQ